MARMGAPEVREIALFALMQLAINIGVATSSQIRTLHNASPNGGESRLLAIGQVSFSRLLPTLETCSLAVRVPFCGRHVSGAQMHFREARIRAGVVDPIAPALDVPRNLWGHTQSRSILFAMPDLCEVLVRFVGYFQVASRVFPCCAWSNRSACQDGRHKCRRERMNERGNS